MIPVALDLETFLIDDPAKYPKPVCLSFYSDKLKGVVGNGDPPNFNVETTMENFLKNPNFLLIFHNAKFDLHVIWDHYPRLRQLIVKALDEDRVADTMIRNKLFFVSLEGRLPNRSSLAACCKRWLGKDIDAFKKGDDIWRLRYSELDGVMVKDYPQDAYDYALNDTKYTFEVWHAQEKARQAKGPGSFGVEYQKVRTDFALAQATKEGIRLNAERVGELAANVESHMKPIRETLINMGFARETRTGKFQRKTKVFQEYLAQAFPEEVLEAGLTKAGLPKIDKLAMELYPHTDEVEAWKEYQLWQKLETSYIPKMLSTDRIHAEYDVIKETGRCSSRSGRNAKSLNIQQQPRSGGVRECYEPDDGYLLATLDYAAIEFCTIAQFEYEVFKTSTIGDWINGGKKPRDAHAIMGAAVEAFNKGRPIGSIEDLDIEGFATRRENGCKVAKAARNKGKPLGLSMYGGCAERTMASIYKAQTGNMIDIDDVKKLREVHARLCPTITAFMGYIAKRDDPKYKGLDGYVLTHLCENPDAFYKARRYRYTVQSPSLADRFFVRSNCTYCQSLNGVSMQTRAAMGLDCATWECFKYCYDENAGQGLKLAFSIHDELGFQIPKSFKWEEEQRLRELAKRMIKGMKMWTPDVRIKVEGGTMDRWTKDESAWEMEVVEWE